MNYIWDIKTGYATKGGQYKTTIENNFIFKYFPERKHLKILDIGGGSGRFAIPLAKLGYSLTVLDPNKEALDILCARHKNISLENTTFEEYKTDVCFDFVLMIEVQGNFSDLEKIYQKVKQLTSKRAIMIFTASNKNSIKYKVRKYFNHYHYPGIKDYKTYKKMLSKAGFEIIAVKGFNWLPTRVNSNSILVTIFAFIERIFKLNRWVNQSPELLFCVKKK